ncbi:alpha/beta hydrolase [cyanobiont of Ornithocercus magnificus]|nr:alpha/beta hydrolase [cyanobiont of Ornithocercus magnificus]
MSNVSCSSTLFPLAWIEDWEWNGQSISLASPGISGKRDVVILIHGFGACKEHWRFNIGALKREYDVIAVDLLGFGASAKPHSRLKGEPADKHSVCYGIDLWAQQVTSLIRERLTTRVHLIGNSIGGVVALAAAHQIECKGGHVTGIILINCAQRAMDDKNIKDQATLHHLGRPLLKQLVRRRWLTEPLFWLLSKPAVIQKILKLAYPTGSHIDADLVRMLHRAATDPGATESFRGFINMFNDVLVTELLAQLKTPVRILWGQADPWEPISEARLWTSFPCVQQLEELPGLGHCPHDEAPDRVNPVLLSMLQLHSCLS